MNAPIIIPTNDEIQRISNVLRTALGLDKTTINNAETKQNDLNTNYTGEQYYNSYTIYSESVMNGQTSSSDTETSDTTANDNTGYQSTNDSNTWQSQSSTSQWNNGY